MATEALSMSYCHLSMMNCAAWLAVISAENASNTRCRAPHRCMKRICGWSIRMSHGKIGHTSFELPPR